MPVAGRGAVINPGTRPGTLPAIHSCTHRPEMVTACCLFFGTSLSSLSINHHPFPIIGCSSMLIPTPYLCLREWIRAGPARTTVITRLLELPQYQDLVYIRYVCMHLRTEMASSHPLFGFKQ